MAEKLTVEELKNWRAKKACEKNASLWINEENKMLLREILDIEQVKILSEDKTKDGDTITVEVPFCEADKKTRNGRIYSEWLLTREVGKVQDAIKSGSFLGMSDHPESGLGNVKNASHIVEKLTLDEETKIGSATLKILSTSKGKDIQTIIRQNGRLGVSMRGTGSVSRDGQVQGDYTFLGLDICLNPSVENAMFDKSNIVESVNFQEEKNAPSEEVIRFIQSKVYEEGKETGSKETYEEFLAENGVAIRASILAEHDGISVEEALIQMGEEGVLRKMKSEEKVKVWTADELYWESKASGVDPKVMAKRLNENEAKKQTDRDSGLSKEAIGSLLEEATKAGVDIGNIEERKKYLEFAKTQATPGELTIHERAILVDKKMVAEGKESNIEFIEEVLRHKDKEAEIQEKRNAFLSRWDQDISKSGRKMTNEEYRVFINKRLKAAGYKILEEG